MVVDSPEFAVTDWLLATGGGTTVMKTVAVLLTRPVAVSVTLNWKLSLPVYPALGVKVTSGPLPLSWPSAGGMVMMKASGSPLGSVLARVISLAAPASTVIDWLLAAGGGRTFREMVAMLLTRPVAVSVAVNWKRSLPVKPALGARRSDRCPSR